MTQHRTRSHRSTRALPARAASKTTDNGRRAGPRLAGKMAALAGGDTGNTVMLHGALRW